MAESISRRAVLGTLAATALACRGERAPLPATASSSPAPAVTRPLGKTGVHVEPVSLGGEGSLRSTGEGKLAVATILQALELGVRYCDTAPAYEQSQDYYGEAFRRMPGARARVFLASKTHLRDREGSLALLDDSLKRLGTDALDLWQLHDLRSTDDLDAIFAKGGAIEAVEQAKKQGRIRFAGITGHHDPAVLVEAMKRYAFDTVLCAINPADPARLPFISTVVPEARARGVGVIAMKIFGRGRILQDGVASVRELVSYAMSIADTAIIGCMSPDEVRANLDAGRHARPATADERTALEQLLAPKAARYAYFKAS